MRGSQLFVLCLFILISTTTIIKCSVEPEAIDVSSQEICQIEDFTQEDIEAMVHHVMLWIRAYQEWGYTLTYLDVGQEWITVHVDYVYYDYYNPQFTGADHGQGKFKFNCDYDVIWEQH